MAVDLSKVGSILKAAREEKGISLEEVSNVLCLRKSLIEAIETGKWDVLPHEVYVRSYLKEYAIFLNVAQQVFPELREKRNEIEKNTPDVLIEDTIKEKSASRFPKISFTNTNLPRKAFVYCAIGLILIGFYGIDRINKGFTSLPAPKIETTTGSITQSQGVPDTVITTHQQVTPPFTEGKKLMISCRERTWVSVVIDDAEKKEFMLNAQEMIILHAKESFDLLIGNAGGVSLILNGKDTEFTGKSGEVKRIKLS